MAAAKDEVTLEIGGRQVLVTHPDKLLIASAKVSKMARSGGDGNYGNGGQRSSGGRPSGGQGAQGGSGSGDSDPWASDSGSFSDEPPF